MIANNSNRRKGSRFPMNIPATVSMKGQVVEGAEICDLSLGGMCIVFYGPFDEATTGKVWFEREYGNNVIDFKADFRRLWVKPVYEGAPEKKMGVLFEEIRSEELDKLLKILKFEKRYNN